MFEPICTCDRFREFKKTFGDVGLVTGMCYAVLRDVPRHSVCVCVCVCICFTRATSLTHFGVYGIFVCVCVCVCLSEAMRVY
jgi:hypothetical protein